MEPLVSRYPFSVLLVGLGREVEVGDRVEQQLRGEAGALAVAGGDRDRRGEVPAGAVPAGGDALGVASQLGGVLGHPRGRREAVVEGSGVGVLEREPVVDRDDDGAGPVGDPADRVVADVDVADHPAAAVEVHDDRLRPVARGGVDASGDVPGGSGDRPVLGGDLLGLALQIGEALDGFPRLRDGHVLERRQPGRIERGEQLLGFGVQGHDLLRIVSGAAAAPARRGRTTDRSRGWCRRRTEVGRAACGERSRGQAPPGSAQPVTTPRSPKWRRRTSRAPPR
jgi:hypothetical protein